MIVAGIGCRADFDAAEVVALVRAALAQANLAEDRLTALATAAFKAENAALRAAARALDRPLLAIDPAALKLAEARCVTVSTRSQDAAGVASVAEASALAAAGPSARLLVPRIAGARVTCALAERAS